MSLPLPASQTSLLLRAASRGLPRIWKAGLSPYPDLTEATLMAQATKATGLSDFGDPWFRGSLDVLLPALRDEARLNPFGRMMAHGQLLKTLKERLWAQELFRRHPESLERPLAAPVIVVGQMRSGTTRVHRLLAADSRFAHLRLYEAMCPVPWPSSLGKRHDPRIRYTQMAWRALNWFAPGNEAVHPTGALEADEELGLLENSVWGSQIEAQRRVPSWARWSEATDATPAYRHMANLLRLTGWFRGEDPAKTWILKTPQHAQDLPALLAVFPDARLVFLHRDPVAVVASSCSLAWNHMVVHSDELDPHWVGAEWLHKTRHRASVTAKARHGIPTSRCVDLHYDEVSADWRAAMRKVYAMLDIDMTPAESAMAVYSAREQRHTAHRYDLADFGLSAAQIRRCFADGAAQAMEPA